MKEDQCIRRKSSSTKRNESRNCSFRFNEIIVNKLLGGAVDGLVRHGVEEENITAAWVPGAFEIPQHSALQNPESMMRLSVSEQLSVEIPAIMIMCAMKFPKESHRSDLQQECRCYLA